MRRSLLSSILIRVNWGSFVVNLRILHSVGRRARLRSCRFRGGLEPEILSVSRYSFLKARIDKNGHEYGSQNNPFPFQLGMFEVQDDADSQFGDAEIIYHLAALVVGNSINAFGVHDNGGMGDQIGNALTDHDLLVKDGESSLLVEGDALQLELNDQRIFVNLLVESVPDPI